VDQLLKQVRRARWRLGVQRFVGVLGWWWFGALLLAAVLATVDKFYPTGVPAWAWAAGALGLGFVGAVIWATFSGRGLMDAAIELDRRCGLKERVSSSLALSDEQRETELGQALIEDSRRRVERIDVEDHFRVVPSRRLLLPVLPAAAVLLVAWLVNPANTANRAAASSEIVVKKQIAKSSESLRRKLVEQRKRAQQQGLKDAEDLFRQLEQDVDNLPKQSEGDRKQALVKLNDLARELQKRRQTLADADQIQKQLNQLKDLGKGPADKLLEEIQRGDLNKAVEQLEKLKADLLKGNLNPEQQKQLAQQLEQMKDKLKELAEGQRQAQKDLENRIRQAQQAGQLDEANKLQEQLDRLRQQMPQLDKLDQLADKLGECSKCLNEGQLKDAAEMLGQLQNDVGNLQEQLEELRMLDDAMDQLAQGRDQMNCQQCNGEGCGFCQGEKPGDGMGRGRGIGARPEQQTGTNFFDTKASVKVGRGSASVVGEVEGPNAREEVRQQIQEQFDSARHQPADPLTDQHMPRKHRQHALEYFDRLREGR